MMKRAPVTVDHGAEERREALTILSMHGKFLLNENHDDVAVAVCHRKMHWGIAKFINDVVKRAHFEEIADKRG